MNSSSATLPIDALRAAFGDALQESVRLAGYTTARTGGPVDVLLQANSAADLETFARKLWDLNVPFQILGYGSNVLVSDDGLHGVIILNRAKRIEIFEDSNPPAVWAESGANLGTIARQAALHRLSGFEWAATVPGTLGGAVYGNAGAHGGDMNASLLLAEILHPNSKETWTADQMEYAYRTSRLKREKRSAIILSAQIRLQKGDPQIIRETMERYTSHRRRTQPPGASMGSMFKNPPGDYAGRLIEAAGLKGFRVGDAEISTLHANFFINHGGATAKDIGTLIRTARQTVAERFGTILELEVELLGNWQGMEQSE